MRFMLLVIPKGYETAPAGAAPDAEAVSRMMKYNESLQKAGVLLALDGLHPPSMGARVTFEGGKPRVQDGPFAEAKEVLGGYFLLECASMDEAVDWAARIPGAHHGSVEVRPVHAGEDEAESPAAEAAGVAS